MSYILMPKGVRTPPMRPDTDDRHWLPWTRQPGGDGLMHVSVQGSSGTPPVEGDTKHHSVDSLPKWYAPQSRDSSPSVVTLRGYQHECIEAIGAAWESGTQAPLVVLPTGAGKTIIAASMMEAGFGAQGHRSLFLAHRQELLQQTMEKILLVSSRFAPTLGIVQSKKNEMGRDITIGSIQTLGGRRSSRRLQQLIDAGPYDQLWCDEAHHAVSPQWMRVIQALRDAYPNLRVAGMTATPGRADGIALDQVFDDVVYEKNLIDLVRMGYLVPPKGFRVNLGLNLDRVATSGGDFVQKQLAKLMNQDTVNRAVVEAWREYGHNRKTVVFAVDVAHATALRDEFRDAGYESDVVHGTMKKRERNAVFKRFRQNETKILVNCEIVTEGFDETSIECILHARPTQSQALYIQMTGRGLRLHPGKTECLIVDCVGNSEKHRPMQLASLAGFDPEQRHGGGAGTGEGGDGEEEDEDDLTVVSANVTGEEFDLTSHRARTRYQWRETSLGWVLPIPRIGYYLCAWHTRAHTKCTIRFYDQRPGRRDTPPREVLKDPVDFEMAYGLVESEMDRIFQARMNRGLIRRRDGAVYEDPRAELREFAERPDHGDMPPEIDFVDLDEGTDEPTHVPEAFMLKDAAWRERSPSAKQLEFLKKLGVKERSLPETAGEASDLITILRIERDAKMRLPATQKQIAYLKVNELPLKKGLTKGAAARMIWQHRKATEGR